MTKQSGNPNRLLTLTEVMELTSLRKSTIYLRQAQGRFPQGVKLGRRTAWVLDEVSAWIDATIDAARSLHGRQVEGAAQ